MVEENFKKFNKDGDSKLNLEEFIAFSEFLSEEIKKMNDEAVLNYDE